MTEPTDLAESVGRSDRVELLQWDEDGLALVPTQATIDQLGAAVVNQIGLHPDVLGRVPKTLSGSGAPASDLGINGDSYVDLVNGTTYSKAAGTWTLQGGLGMNAKGAYNAATNSPALGDDGAGGVKGDVYWVSEAGTVEADGIGSVLANDQIVNLGGVWVKRPKTDTTFSADQGSVTELGVQRLDVGTDSIGQGDLRWSPVQGLVVDSNGRPLQYWRPDGWHVTARGLVKILEGDTATYVTGLFTDVTSDTVTTDLLTVEGGTFAPGDARWSGEFAYVMLGASGLPIHQITRAGVFLWGSGRFNHLTLGSEPTEAEHAATKAYVDANAGGTGAAYTATDLAAIDAECAALSMAVLAHGNPALAAIETGESHFIDMGQSFALGFGGALITWPVAIDGIKSFGDRPANSVDTDEFVAVGDSEFTERTNGGTEVPLIGTADHFRWRQMQHLMTEEDATRGILISSIGDGGQPVEAFLPGATPTELFGQFTSLIDQCVSYAAGLPVRYRVRVCCWTQGEANYANEGVDHTRAGYLEKWQEWKAAARDYIIANVSDDGEPGFFLPQTSSRWDTEAGDTCTIGLAQIDAMLADDAVFVFGPYYAYPKDGTHLTANGYRMMGDQRGKVIWQVMGKRQNWRPCMVTRATFRGSRIVVRVHTPVPPLQVKQAYDQDDLVSYANHGLVVYDDNGPRTIDTVTIQNSSIVIDLSDGSLDAADNPRLGYAKFGTDGGGNICDSDRTLSLHENTLTGARHALVNWLCATDIAIEDDEL